MSYWGNNSIVTGNLEKWEINNGTGNLINIINEGASIGNLVVNSNNLNLPTEVVMSCANNGNLFIGYKSSTGNHILKKDHAIGNWSVRFEDLCSLSPFPLWGCQTGGFCIKVSPNNENNLYYGGDRLYFSNNSGSSFAPCAPYWNTGTEIHADIRDIQFQFSSATDNTGVSDIVYMATDGGVGAKLAGVNPIGNNATVDINGTGLNISQFYGLDVSPSGTIMAGGTMHDGIMAFESKQTPQWLSINGGQGTASDAFQAVINRQKPNEAIVKEWGNLTKTNAGGGRLMNNGSWYTSPNEDYYYSNGINYKQASFLQFVHDDKDNLYYPRARLYKLDNITNQWDCVNPGNVASNNNDIPNFNGDNLTILDNGTNIRRLAILSGSDKSNANNSEIVYGYLAYDWGSDVNGSRKLFVRKPSLDPNDVNGYTIWKDRTPPAAFEFKITDIKYDPANPNRVWVSLGDVIQTWNNNKVRVYYSDNWGDNWVDMSEGLPKHLPVNCMVFQKGSENELYAATDVGVFRLNFNNSQPKLSKWTCFNDGLLPNTTLPNSMIVDLKINYCSGKLIAATHGRGVYETDLFTTINANATLPKITNTISTSTNWSTDKYLEGSLLIKKGATLTIEGNANPSLYTSTTTIHMPLHGAIYVEKGAKLVVKGAKLTNECGGMWYGIQAYGDGVSPQTMDNNNIYYPNQGYVVLKENAILENAEEAFTNAGGKDNWNTGGVISATNTIFRNNRRSAAFMKYQNMQLNGKLYPDKSNFLNCTFIVDKTIMHNSPLISMWAVRGVALIGCKFLNTSNLDQGHENGIFTLDASYSIYNSLEQTTLFEGLQTGLLSASYSWDNKNALPITVEGATFDKNEIGIDFKDLLYPLIKDNTFNTGMIQHPFNPALDFYPTLGTRFNYVSDYIYCNNNHTWPYTTPNPNVQTWNCGLDITNSGPDDVIIEKNNFDGMQVGTCIAEVNGSQDARTGINLRWNKNENNTEYDFVFGGNAIIRPTQSADLTTNNAATGNTFSNNGSVNWGHWPGGNDPTDYLYNPNITNQIPNNAFGVNPIATTDILSEPLDCAKYATVHKVKRGLLTLAEFNSLKIDYNTAESNFNTIKTLYNQLIDGGSTINTEIEIENATNNQIMLLRADMLAHSPYLSIDILEKLAEENILPQAILLEVILANPEGSQSATFIKYLQYTKPNPMPTYMINMIKSSWSGATARSIMEKSMMQQAEIMEAKKSEVIMAARIDGTFISDAELLSWISKMPTIKSQYELIEYHLSNKNYSTANTLLTNIPSTFKMTPKDVQEYDAYSNFYNFKKNLMEKNIEINQLDSPKINSLKLIADANINTFARSMARSTLCFFYNICYPTPIKKFNNNTANKMELQSNNITPADINVYPNPAKEYVVFAYNLEIGNDAKSLVITDLVGHSLYNTNLSSNKGQHIYNSTQLADGTYIYYITTNNGLKKSGKFTIKK